MPLFVLVAATVLTACSGSTTSTGADLWPDTIVAGKADVLPTIVSSAIPAGVPTRFLFSILDKDQNPIAAPSTTVRVAFYFLDASKTDVVFENVASFLWAIPDVRGMYEMPVMFPSPGRWGAAFTVTPQGKPAVTERVRFDVHAPQEVPTPTPGTPAPAVVNKTAADAGGDLSNITTDPHPEPDLYTHTVAEEVNAHKPFLVIFSTPKFCTSQVCGPTLETVKAVRPEFPGLDFIHVEVYENLKANQPTLAPAVAQWHLPSEPWTFVVGSDGKIATAFEGPVTADDLRQALQQAH